MHGMDLAHAKWTSGNGCVVAENPTTVTRSSGQMTCDTGGDDGAMLEADEECSETEHQTDGEEIADEDDGGGDDDDEDETEDEDEAEAEEVEGKGRNEAEESDVRKNQLYFVTCYHVQIVLVCTMILTFLCCAMQVMLSSWRFWKLFFVNKRTM